MKEGRQLATVWVLAALLLVAGMLATLVHAWRWPAQRARLEAIAEDQAAVLEAAARYGSPQVLLRGLEPSPQDSDFADWLGQPALGLQVEEAEEVVIAPGWTARRLRVSWQDRPLSQVSRILEQAGAARPPWRLVEAQLSASRAAANAGRGDLLLEHVERSTVP